MTATTPLCGLAAIASMASWIQGMNEGQTATAHLDRTTRFHLRACKQRAMFLQETAHAPSGQIDEFVDVDDGGRACIRPRTELISSAEARPDHAARLLGRFARLRHALWAVAYLEQDMDYAIETATGGAFCVYAGDEASAAGDAQVLLHTRSNGMALPSLRDLSSLGQSWVSNNQRETSAIIYSRVLKEWHRLSLVSAQSRKQFDISHHPDIYHWGQVRHFIVKFEKAPPYNPLNPTTRHFPKVRILERSKEGELLKMATCDPSLEGEYEHAFSRILR